MKKEIIYFDVQEIWPIALVLIVAGIGISFGLDIIDNSQEDLCDNTYEHYGNDSICYLCNSSHTIFNGTGGDYICHVTNNASNNFSAAVNADYAYNVTNSTTVGIANISGRLPTIALVVSAAILIGILVRNLGMGGSGN